VIGQKVKQATPRWARNLVPQSLKDRVLGTTRVDVANLVSMTRLRNLMGRYQTKDLVNVSTGEFRRRIDEFLALEDAAMEGFADPSMQRDRSVKFYWANDHDFGDFSVKGILGDRHISLIAALNDWFPVLPKTLDGVKVMDIGCWTGGTSLLLHAMGANVVAVEEVRKYIDCLTYLRDSFALSGLDPRNLSLYECVTSDLQDAFDYVLFAGVLYHVTDPVLALRIVYNSLKDGGTCIIETAVSYSDRDTLAYEGPRVHYDGAAVNLSRSGWNWFLPSPSTLAQMMRDVGFVDIQMTSIVDSSKGGRIFAAGKRDRHRDMTRAGLSVRGIR
jgi:tRNA (mo5U34)-methyltransferase